MAVETGCSHSSLSGEASRARQVLIADAPDTNWRTAVPVLASDGLTLREIVQDDASPLLEMLATKDVSRFMSPMPPTLASFGRFVNWIHQQRSAGQCVAFVVVPPGFTNPVGVLQMRSLEPGFQTAEWGFAVGAPFWGTGLFASAAQLVLDFAFTTVGVRRLEARACAENRRGNGALRKLGATPEGVLRRAFLWEGSYHDQVLWSILDSDWTATLRGTAR
jgi:[ribosomal protein S5]-alanine N-acetyltransferase